MNIGTRGTEHRYSQTGQTARPSKRRSCLHGLRVLQGDRPKSKMDASITSPPPWPTSPPGKTALFNNTLRRQEIHRRQDSFFGKSVAKFTIKLVAGRPEREPAKYHPGTPFIQCPPNALLPRWISGPPNPFFWAEATRSLEVQTACWMKVKELYQSEEEVIGFLKAGKFKELFKSGNRFLGFVKYGNVRNCSNLRSPSKVDWWSQARLWSISGPFLGGFSSPLSGGFGTRFCPCF
jgi:hypothetical protein